MRLWKVEFDGYWPVGAVAVAQADSGERAMEEVLRVLPLSLRGKNSFTNMTATEIDFVQASAVVLLDGDYQP
jgi:hypothetical protein